MGSTNSYRYVNASNVYNKGKSDMFNNVSPTLASQNYCNGSSTDYISMTNGYIFIVCSPALSVDCNTKVSQWYNSYGSIKWVVFKFNGSGTKVTYSGYGEYQLAWLLNNYIP